MKTKTILLLLFTVSVIIFFSSCGDNSTGQPPANNQDSCGSFSSRFEVYAGPSFGGYLPATYTLGSERYYNFFYEVDSICTDYHVSAEFTALAKDTAGRPINFRAAIEWQIFWERSDSGTVNITGGNRIWLADINDLGLRVPFHDNPASVFVNIYVHFPTLGSAALDSAFLRRNLVRCSMELRYKEHKFETDDNISNRFIYNERNITFENNNKDFLKAKMMNELNPYRKTEFMIKPQEH